VARRLVAVAEKTVVADYEAGVIVAAICESHRIALSRLYRILDKHRVARRQPNAPRLPRRLRERILADYRAGTPTGEIARRHGVGHSTVSNVAAKHGVLRNPLHARDELVEMVVRWFVGDETTDDERRAIIRIGCRTEQPGLRSLEHLDPAIAGDVVPAAGLDGEPSARNQASALAMPVRVGRASSAVGVRCCRSGLGPRSSLRVGESTSLLSTGPLAG
jgi:hypothetical protein